MPNVWGVDHGNVSKMTREKRATTGVLAGGAAGVIGGGAASIASKGKIRPDVGVEGGAVTGGIIGGTVGWGRKKKRIAKSAWGVSKGYEDYDYMKRPMPFNTRAENKKRSSAIGALGGAGVGALGGLGPALLGAGVGAGIGYGVGRQGTHRDSPGAAAKRKQHNANLKRIDEEQAHRRKLKEAKAARKRKR